MLYPRATWEALDAFRAYCKNVFTGIRRNVYLPFCVRLILAAFVLSRAGQLPFLIAGAPNPERGAVPAVFDPDKWLCDSETLDALFPNGTNAPEGE